MHGLQLKLTAFLHPTMPIMITIMTREAMITQIHQEIVPTLFGSVEPEPTQL